MRFAARGDAVVLAARDATALQILANALRRSGADVIAVPADVSIERDVDHLAAEAMIRYGRIDVWVNDAAVSVWGTLEETPVEDYRRLIDVNVMGVLYGMRAALRVMRAQNGGTIINVGSVESERALPLQSAYAATKHAVKGMTDALRVELQAEKSPIQVTLILPASINTPLFRHARSRMGVEPMPIPPVYEPAAVAEAIVFAADHRRRQIVVGGAGKGFIVAEKLAPGLFDRFMAARGNYIRKQQSGRAAVRADNLDLPSGAPSGTRGPFGKRAHQRSVYTEMFEQRRAAAPLALVALAVGAALIFRRTLARRVGID